MRKLTLFTLGLALVFLAFSVSTYARPVEQGQNMDELTALAAYAPAESAIFAAIRTDEGYFDTLDALVANISAGLDPELVDFLGVQDFRTFFDEMVLADVNFAEDVRPWLGNTAGFYVPGLDSLLFGGGDLPFVLALGVNDQGGADAFVTDMLAVDLASGDMTRTTDEDGIIYYEPALRFMPGAVITEDALIFGLLGRNFSDVILPGADAPSLLSAPNFTQTQNAMPRPDYNFLLYVDPSSILELVAVFLPLLGPELGVDLPPELLDPVALSATIGQLAVGGVIVEDRAMVLDITSTSEALRGLFAPPVDVDLLARVPDDAALLIQGSGLGDIVRTVVDSAALLDELLLLVEPGALDEIAPFRFGQLSTFFRLSFEGMSGLPYHMTMDALSSDFITFVTAKTEVGDDFAEVIAGTGTVLRSTNTAVTDVLFERISEDVLSIFNIATLDDGVLNIPFGEIFNDFDDMRFSITTDDDLIFIGDEATVAALRDADGAKLTDSASYAFESGLFLPNASTVWYINTAPALMALSQLLTMDMVRETMTEDDLMMAMQAVNALSVLETSAITVNVTDDAFSLRATLTFAVAD